VNLLDQRFDLCHQTGFLGSQENSKGASQGEPEPLGVAPSQPLVDDDEAGTGFLGQGNDFRFSPVKI